MMKNVVILSLAIIMSPAMAHDVADRRIESAYQLLGFILADTNLVNREWSKYQIFQPYAQGFRDLTKEEQIRLTRQIYEDISIFLTPARDSRCADFFAPPRKTRVMTWGARRIAQNAAIYVANLDMQDAWVIRSVAISRHKKSDMRLATKQSIEMHAAWDKLCLESDMTVQEVAFTFSNSPEVFEEPEWKINKK